ncbi:glycosyltransferase [Rossellomorea marisflavi]|uniref:glycosyltransferase family 2 protein n=1 Tax=Rossellomorea marisflavi TaxID=189381 RepID=UPI00207AFA49|nr:glycosyltransferase [Rossellomorea marisflavi]USK91801.1 glycosyltransferase [Rossellomorea marisflavi]
MAISKEPLISVIVPTFNRGHMIRRTINTVLNQTYNNFELIIVDDGSTDDTMIEVKRFSDKRIKYHKLDNNSKGRKTRNCGIKIAEGQFIAFLDSDDEWDLKKLEKQIKFITENNLFNKKFMCFTDLVIKTPRKSKEQKNNCFNNENLMEYILVEGNEVQTSSYILPTLLAKNTLFNENLKKHQDWDFCLRLLKNGAQLYNIPESLSVWNVGKSDTRISNSYKSENVSLTWFNNNKVWFTKRSMLAFNVIMLTEYYLMTDGSMKVLRNCNKAYKEKAISREIYIKTLAKIFLYKCRIYK